MTTVVSRLYDSAETAESVAGTLRAEGFPDATIDVITEADAEKIKAARVSDSAAASYAKAMTDGRALFVCRAPFTPFGAARRAMEVADGQAWIDAGMGARNEHIREEADLEIHTPSILEHHPLMMTRDDYVGSGWSGWTLSGVFDFPLVSSRRDREPSVISGGAYMSRRFWPGKLLSSKPRKSSVMDGGRRISRMFWPMPLVTKRRERRSVMKGHPLISQRFGMRMLSDHR